MNLNKYKPGRRLDAMVAMCLGWRWWKFSPCSLYGGQGRILTNGNCGPGVTLGDLATTRTSLSNSWNAEWSKTLPRYSTSFGSAAEAALEAGVFDKFAFKYLGQYRLISAKAVDDILTATPAHCLCLGILAIQPEETLAEYESWLKGVE